MPVQVRYAALMLLCAAWSGCALFSSKPPLPRHAAIERGGSPAAGTDYRALVEEAQIIYFPEERAASGAKSEPAALLLEAVAASGKPYAIAWSLIEASQQSSLDELQAGSGSTRDELVAQLDLTGTGRAREQCRSVLRDVRLAGARHVALRVPRTVLERVASGGTPAPEEHDYLPRGFTAPAGGFQAYAESLSSQSALNDRSVAGAYRAELMRRQFAAETIVRYFRDAAADARLIVFADSAEFADGQGVPFYVAQKIDVRQLVLGRETSEPQRSKLLTRFDGNLRRSFQIVDRAPGAARD
jgi:uncharacterized iron-regulated protein